MHPSNKRLRYIVTSCLIGLAHTQNDSWNMEILNSYTEVHNSVIEIHNLIIDIHKSVTFMDLYRS